jgi:hypothetical protein
MRFCTSNRIVTRISHCQKLVGFLSPSLSCSYHCAPHSASPSHPCSFIDRPARIVSPSIVLQPSLACSSDPCLTNKHFIQDRKDTHMTQQQRNARRRNSLLDDSIRVAVRTPCERPWWLIETRRRDSAHDKRSPESIEGPCEYKPWAYSEVSRW